MFVLFTVVELIIQLLNFVLQLQTVVPQRIGDLAEVLVLYVLHTDTQILQAGHEQRNNLKPVVWVVFVPAKFR